MKRAAVVGAGSWGTALAWLAGGAGMDVRIWGPEPDVLEDIGRNHANQAYLPEARLPGAVVPADGLGACLQGAELVILAVPSHVMREVCRKMAGIVGRDAVLVSAAKGIEEDSLARMSEVIAEELPGARVAVLSGPSFAREVVEGHPTAVVVASPDQDAARGVQEALAGPSFRLYTHEDVAGVEIGGATKNVVAIAAGAVEGLGYGTNTMAALITRGLREIARLAVACGGRDRTLSGLSGMGDLVLTCTGALSRNKTVGLRLARGERLEEILRTSTQVAEGVRTTRSVNRLAERLGVEVPIAGTVEQVLYRNRDPHEALRDLMGRQRKGEFE